MRATDGGGRRLEIVCLSGILILYAVALAAYFVPVLSGTDANGYHVSARMVELHGRFYQLPKDELSFVGGMWVVNDRGQVYPKYPPGYPGISGLALKLFGTPADLIINPLCAWLAVLGAYVACRTRLPGWAAVLAAWTVATTPVSNMFAVDQVSHAPGLAALTWGYAVFFLGRRGSGALRLLSLFVSGLLIGVAASIRYPDVLLSLPIMLWLLLPDERHGGRPITAWLAGLALPLAGLAAYHWVAFGHPLRTGYSWTQEQTAFSASYFLHNLRYYVPAIMTDGIGPLFILSCCGLLAMWHRDRRAGLFYAAWTVPLLLLYASYYFLPEENVFAYTRFLLPLVLPCVMLAFGFLNDLLPKSDPGLKRLVVLALALCQGGWGGFLSLKWMETRYSINEVQRRRVDFVGKHVPEGSAVFAARVLLDDFDYQQKYYLYEFELLDQDLHLASHKRFLNRPYDQYQRRVQFEKLVKLDSESYIKRIRGLIDSRLAEGRQVYLIGNDMNRQRLAETYSPFYEIDSIASLPLGRIPYRIFAPDRAPAESGEYAIIHVVRIQPRAP